MTLNEPDFDGAIRTAQMACVGAERDSLLEELVKVRAQCAVRPGDELDLEILAATYSDRLMGYPADAALFVLREWPSKSKWWPTWFDLEQRLEAVCGSRMAMNRALPRVERQWLAENGLA